MERNLPLISCVCITRDKPEMLERVISCFIEQTYPNKELVILYEDTDQLTRDFFVRNNIDKSIRVLEVAGLPKQTIGKLRNYAIFMAAGEFVCQWDDDDWYHSRRLEEQYSFIVSTGKAGSILTRWIVFNSMEGKAYISNCRLWEGSILCRKKQILDKGYEDIIWGEDTPVINSLHESGSLALIENQPVLYIYIYHGNNSWNFAHWNYIFECSKELSEMAGKKVQQILTGAYSNEVASSILDDIVSKQKEYENS